jgi:hypothetical protein
LLFSDLFYKKARRKNFKNYDNSSEMYIFAGKISLKQSIPTVLWEDELPYEPIKKFPLQQMH